jgi:hypothetical protein
MERQGDAMRRIFATAVATVLGMLAMESATAGVRYVFETLTPGTDNGGGLVFLDGVIEFDRAFWDLGQQFHHEVNNIDELVSPYFGVEFCNYGRRRPEHDGGALRNLNLTRQHVNMRMTWSSYSLVRPTGRLSTSYSVKI